MLGGLPDECKQLLWRFLDASSLCRVACVARGVESGVALAPLWKRLAVDMVRREIRRIDAQRVPVEAGLQRQNATRRLDLTGGEGERDELQRGRLGMVLHTRREEVVEQEEEEQEKMEEVGVDETFWKDWYREFHVAARAFDGAHKAFEEGKNELQELKRQRSDLRELLQATKSKSQSDKKLRRMHMNCVKWLNRTNRRAAASNQATNARHVALTKSEITDELQAIESTIQWQSKQLFSLRSQYQKRLHRLTTEVARGKRVLADFSD